MNTPEKLLTIFTIYDHPKDQPEHFVVRQWFTNGGPEPIAGEAKLAKTIREARAWIPSGLVRFERNPGDDPCILETWI